MKPQALAQEYNYMPQLTYLGKDVGLVRNFHMSYPKSQQSEDSKKDNRDLEEIVHVNSCPYLMAITANYFQKNSHETLILKGFKKVFTFLSAHNVPAETLTLWVRKDGYLPSVPKDKAKGPIGYNCSVSFHKNEGKILTVRISKPNEVGFKKIRNIPIWTKIDKKYLVEEKPLTSAKN